MSDKIPKPVKKQNKKTDNRKEYLEKWKELFESIHPEIKVFLEDLPALLENLAYNIELSEKYTHPQIIIKLPSCFEMNYLVGILGDEMFSDVEIENDFLHRQEPQAFPCEPHVFPWEKYYNTLCMTMNDIYDQIPNPEKLIKYSDLTTTECTAQDITEFLINKLGMLKMAQHHLVDYETDCNKFTCSIRTGEIHYLYWSEEYKHFSVGVRHEEPKGKPGGGAEYYTYIMISKTITSIMDAALLFMGHIDPHTLKLYKH